MTEQNPSKLSLDEQFIEALKEGDVIWFNKKDALSLPFNSKLYILEQSNILVVEYEVE